MLAAQRTFSALMPYYQAFTEFTAQSKSVRALMRMYSLLERGQPPPIPLTPVVVFLAFSIESYLNSLGARAIPFWSEIERMPWKAKVNVLHAAAGHEPDWSREPLQFAREVFSLRDRLAHGKPERVEGPKHPDHAGPTKFPSGELEPDWYESITLDWILDAKERFEVLMRHLAGLFGHGPGDYLHSSTGGILASDNP